MIVVSHLSSIKKPPALSVCLDKNKKLKLFYYLAFLFFTVAYNISFRSKPFSLLWCYPLFFFLLDRSYQLFLLLLPLFIYLFLFLENFIN